MRTILITKAEEDGGTYLLDVEGISELVKGKRFKFDTSDLTRISACWTR